MDLILTMAGKYSRFVKEGYKIPKYLLPWGSSNILSEILSELKEFDNTFLIANKADSDYFEHVKKTMQANGIDKNNLIAISDTKGQAETAFVGINELNKAHKLKDSVIFHNIDTILYSRSFSRIKETLKNNSGYIDVFKSNNHAYSYVMAKDNIVNEISEKILISDMATSGLYGFSSAELFIENYNSELYISGIYKKMISNNHKICISKIHDEKDTIVLGTPSDYLKYSKMNGLINV